MCNMDNTPTQKNLVFPWGTQRNLKGDLKFYRHHFSLKNKKAGRLMVGITEWSCS